MRVVYWPNIAIGREQLVHALGGMEGVELVVADSAASAEAELARADGLVFANPSAQEGAVVARSMKNGAPLQWVHFVSAGMDGVVHCGLGPDVRVTHTPGATADAVGAHALALLLALMRQLPGALQQQAVRHWDRASLSPKVTSVDGKTVVLLGHGAIGKFLARVLSAMDADLRIVSRTKPQGVDSAAAYTFERIGEAMDGAHVVICALPLSELTQGLVSESVLRRMARGAFVVNVGRGPIIEREGLIACLNDGHLQGAGLDVTDPEPLEADDAMWSVPNLIVTPHYAGAGSANAASRIAEAAAAVCRERSRRFTSSGDAPS